MSPKLGALSSHVDLFTQQSKDISGIQGALLGTESRREEGIASSSFSLLGPQSPLGRRSDYLVPFSYGAETPGEVLKRAVTFGGRQE